MQLGVPIYPIFDYDVYIENVNEFKGIHPKLDKILYAFTVVSPS